ncbi:MAG TPA: energy transducer TonB [Oceanospirillales bacterium]|nr:energy transducer TonB [Oceanospirillaceae bacterium]HBS43233.1 energy transducer TonB [Oceanospirillales bacterium]|tara:strand:- start:4500 stop:5375 length:876 start_codon:yes stop_codon:yes gene_type:complete
MADSTVTSNDRLLFALFVALMLHAMVVLGISFEAEPTPPFASTMEVTLAGYKQNKAPEKADFLAQENQQGSGTKEEAVLQTTDVEAVFHANTIRETEMQEQQASAPQKTTTGQTDTVTTTARSDFAVSKDTTETAAEDLPEGPRQSLLQRSLEIASLQAKLDTMRQSYAKMPRVQRLTAASTMKSADAYYVNSWRRKVEQIGDINYPREAENCYQDCSLRLLVAIDADGSLHEVVILESSGRKVLDEAAVRIVKLAAPFAPFTQEMRNEMDRLEIIRTWQFNGNRYRSGVN